MKAPKTVYRCKECDAQTPKWLGRCPECGNIAPAGMSCAVCSDPTRDRSTICVVEESPQLFAIEKGGGYRGLYHVLGGKLSPLDGENGENLALEPLLQRTAGGSGVVEVILALGSDVEGRATAVYVAELLKQNPVRVSQPARGLPAGADLSYADGATIRAAFAMGRCRPKIGFSRKEAYYARADHRPQRCRTAAG